MSCIMSGMAVRCRLDPVARRARRRSRHIHRTTVSRLCAPLSMKDLTRVPVERLIWMGTRMLL